ncbi:DUF192 domain-containing protein [Candidatus Pacearchaeota archaeon]|jgi:uncharacterized membrane protein (UPF0127 family)|nr:DUF192 domain-containing protein [Candidatus Pacearchaeota archaeon]
MWKNVTFFHKGKRFSVVAKSCNLLRKGIGLMFSRREKAKILIFEFNKKRKIIIHSFFVFFSFAALWINEKNEIVDLKIVKPFTSCVYPSEKSLSLIEIPINKKNKNLIKNIFPKASVAD